MFVAQSSNTLIYKSFGRKCEGTHVKTMITIRRTDCE